MLVDCKGRDYDSNVMYYGKASINSIPEEYTKNRTWKVRINGRLPKGGYYCMPDELEEELAQHGASLSKLNNKFRNVQYIPAGDMIYWVYCMKPDCLYRFKFIGSNLSPKFTEALMYSNGFEIGYTHRIDDESYIDLWYNLDRLCVVTLEYCGNVLIDNTIYYRRSGSDRITQTGYTSYIFEKDRFITEPLFDNKSVEEFAWSKVIFMSSTLTADESYMALTEKDFEVDRYLPRFSEVNYNEMLHKVFNKVS